VGGVRAITDASIARASRERAQSQCEKSERISTARGRPEPIDDDDYRRGRAPTLVKLIGRETPGRQTNFRCYTGQTKHEGYGDTSRSPRRARGFPRASFLARPSSRALFSRSRGRSFFASRVRDDVAEDREALPAEADELPGLEAQFRPRRGRDGAAVHLEVEGGVRAAARRAGRGGEPEGRRVSDGGGASDAGRGGARRTREEKKKEPRNPFRPSRDRRVAAGG